MRTWTERMADVDLACLWEDLTSGLRRDSPAVNEPPPWLHRELMSEFVARGLVRREHSRVVLVCPDCEVDVEGGEHREACCVAGPAALRERQIRTWPKALLACVGCGEKLLVHVPGYAGRMCAGCGMRETWADYRTRASNLVSLADELREESGIK